jgi:hypothetical protein
MITFSNLNMNFTDGYIYLEGILLMESGDHIKRSYVQLPVPSTPSRLKEFFAMTADTYAWRNAVVDLVKSAGNK